MSALFVTGTDTGVGKTYCACALLRGLVAHGRRAVGMKPVASGATAVDGELRNDDALALMAAGNVPAPYASVNPYVFAPAIAPHIAAARVGCDIALPRLQAAYRDLAARADVVVVEGAGGWLTPLSDTKSLADFARMLNAPVILIVGLRLGCLNHALLSAEAVARRGLRLAGWIANDVTPDFAEADPNIAYLAAQLGAPLAHLPHAGAASATLDPAVCARVLPA